MTEKALEDELEKIFSGLTEGKLAETKAMAGLSGIEPAEDAVAEFDALPDENIEMGREILAMRESVKHVTTLFESARSRADKLDHNMDGVVALTCSAKLRIRTALAILHLFQHNSDALSDNVLPRLHDALTEAAIDLEKAEIKADRIPF